MFPGLSKNGPQQIIRQHQLYPVRTERHRLKGSVLFKQGSKITTTRAEYKLEPNVLYVRPLAFH